MVGYTAYKRRTFGLAGKLGERWSSITAAERGTMQGQLGCCGWIGSMRGSASNEPNPAPFDPLLHTLSPDSATYMAQCYPRSPLPPCQPLLTAVESTTLGTLAFSTLSLAPLHLVNIALGVVCANAVDTRAMGQAPSEVWVRPEQVIASLVRCA